MIDVLSTMQVVLQEANFTTHLISVDHFPVVHFEDDTLMGFGCIFDDPDELLRRWNTWETSLLTRYAQVSVSRAIKRGMSIAFSSVARLQTLSEPSGKLD